MDYSIETKTWMAQRGKEVLIELAKQVVSDMELQKLCDHTSIGARLERVTLGIVLAEVKLNESIIGLKSIDWVDEVSAGE